VTTNLTFSYCEPTYSSIIIGTGSSSISSSRLDCVRSAPTYAMLLWAATLRYWRQLLLVLSVDHNTPCSKGRQTNATSLSWH